MSDGKRTKVDRDGFLDVRPDEDIDRFCITTDDLVGLALNRTIWDVQHGWVWLPVDWADVDDIEELRAFHGLSEDEAPYVTTLPELP